MRHISRWILLCTIAAAPAAAADFSGVFKGYDPEGPGCAVGVARQGQPTTFTAYGLADLEHAVPISAETVMEAGSIAKQFTAASILMLAEEGKLALTDDIRKYLPEMPDYGTPITINHLLSHTNGLRDWGGVSVIAGWPRSYVVRTNQARRCLFV
jgi:CubicO group peptidase (beta-lactamase class C family)